VLARVAERLRNLLPNLAPGSERTERHGGWWHLSPDKLHRLSLIIRVAGYALRFFPGAPSDTPSLDAC
jgi:hypothetical protein